MKLIHRHIFGSVAGTCAAAVGLFGFVLLLGNVLRDLLGYLLSGQIEPMTFAKLAWLLVPFVVTYALPMGILTGVLLVLGRMTSDREITALRSAGLSVAGLSAPILFFALLGVGLSLMINFQFMPEARVAYHRELADAISTNPLSFIVPRTFIREFPDKVIYVGSMRGVELQDIWVWELDRQGRARAMHRAESGQIHFDERQNALVLTGRHVTSDFRSRKDPETFDDNETLGQAGEATYVFSLEKLTGAHTVQTKLKWMTFGQLMTEWRRFGAPDAGLTAAERARQRMRVQVTIHEKFATAFSVLSFALIAIPLGIKVSRKETSANLGVALVLAMGYYFATVVVGWFDNLPAFRPDLLMWLPNLGFQALGAWMFYKSDRQ